VVAVALQAKSETATRARQGWRRPKAGGDKGWCLRTARTDLSGGVGTSSIRRPPYGHRQSRWTVILHPATRVPRFLAMMVRAPRAVDLLKHGIAISMDGRGAWRDNVFVERLWRSVKYEEVVCCERLVSA